MCLPAGLLFVGLSRQDALSSQAATLRSSSGGGVASFAAAQPCHEHSIMRAITTGLTLLTPSFGMYSSQLQTTFSVQFHSFYWQLADTSRTTCLLTAQHFTLLKLFDALAMCCLEGRGSTTSQRPCRRSLLPCCVESPRAIGQRVPARDCTSVAPVPL